MIQEKWKWLTFSRQGWLFHVNRPEWFGARDEWLCTGNNFMLTNHGLFKLPTPSETIEDNIWRRDGLKWEQDE